eukprot:363893-Chlamydomonas_euryale.AAC.9
MALRLGESVKGWQAEVDARRLVRGTHMRTPETCRSNPQSNALFCVLHRGPSLDLGRIAEQRSRPGPPACCCPSTDRLIV